MDTANLVEIFCIFDEFCKYFEIELKKHVIEDSNKRHRNRKGRMSDSEIMTILVMFHISHFRDLKNICQIDHTRQRSVNNFAANLLSGMIAYNFMPKKPSMNIEIIDKSRLIA